MTDLQNPIYLNDDKAREHLESLRWPNGAICPRCGVVGNSVKLEGKSTRPGVYKCRDCRKPFSVTVGTVFERSHIPLSKWLLAVHLLSSSKKGVSSHQIHRMLDVTYKTAWFMTHRIREAMAPGKNHPPLGGKDKIVEADETFFGGEDKNRHKADRKRPGPGNHNKQVVFALVERGGSVRSTHIRRAKKVNSDNLRPVLDKQLHEATHLITDEASAFKLLGNRYASHETVNHSIEEYVRGDVYTNTIEGYFSIFKRGMKGIYQHCSDKHLKRYLAEFDFRYNERSALGVDDKTRADTALKGIGGKRLTYRRTHGKRAA